MDASVLLKACRDAGIDLFAGVPDSQLKGLCDTLYARFGTGGNRHVVTANEGNALALAAGHYLATGRPALVYMQNSGLGNIVNPMTSLMDGKVYGLPCLLVVGWRGEPGVHDEPQHITQGELTLKQLELLGVPYELLSKEMTESDFLAAFARLRSALADGRCAALVVRKGALTCSVPAGYHGDAPMSRETAVGILAEAAGPEAVIVSTTGKLSRELFELREARGEGHAQDFLTVGSMGHASSIALGIAMEKPERRVWCLDGDGAALMHLGAMAVTSVQQPGNLVHVVINNGAHETVGGMPVCSGQADWCALATACGYPTVLRAWDEESLREELGKLAGAEGPCFLEVRCALGARADLGRPTTTPKQNRDALMAFLRATPEDDK